ncbi:hypothetical protein CI109_101835 [Kwoniella shandongensis]|uniref:Uncharacterized protein n=1 Tax=Kwoniella shandongensis TaxID=1734106 RepID=A0A5M6C5G1_9TREE|nr:uncharacterized protein CI109_001043 [Kwoniella shandongensis]KAA5530243.1 hypothetical protein CI109_001043 [Kwoniella shandongensis]
MPSKCGQSGLVSPVAEQCSVCFSTLSLSSVYVAPCPLPPFDRLLFCAKDVPRMIHTSIVDSRSLKAAMKGPDAANPQKALLAPMTHGGGQSRSVRFKGLALRSKVAKVNSNTKEPDPGVASKDPQAQRAIVGQIGGASLDYWDIAHAINVQAQISSPIRDYPAIHAQRTGNAALQTSMPSQPSQLQDEEDVMRAEKGNDICIEEDLVKNLIKVFQLSTLDQVEIVAPPAVSHHPPREATPIPTSPYMPLVDESALRQCATELPTRMKDQVVEPQTVDNMDSDGRTECEYDYGGSTIRPSKTYYTLGGFGGGLDSLQGTMRTIARLASRRGIRPTGLGTDSQYAERDGRLPLQTLFSQIQSQEEKIQTVREPVPPAHNEIRCKTLEVDKTDKIESARAMKLLESLLPLAAHLIPLPLDEGDDVDLEVASESESSQTEQEMEVAREGLVKSLGDGLELIMLFEEEPMPVTSELE